MPEKLSVLADSTLTEPTLYSICLVHLNKKGGVMDNQVPTEKLYQLADRYARGDKLPKWVEELLIEHLPPGVFPELRVRREAVIERRRLIREANRFSSSKSVTKESDSEKREIKPQPRRKWTPDDTLVRDIAAAYLAGEETYTQIAVRLKLSSESQIVAILRSAYNAESFAKLKENRRWVILGRKWAKQRGVPYRPEIVVEVLNELLQTISDPSPAVEE